ncbi:uncharacterized protein LOC144825052 [Lissotriton helveticus]
MASNKTNGTWADLQESLNRVRQRHGLPPRARWDYLTTRDVRLSAQLDKRRNSKRALSSHFLPSLSDGTDKRSVHPRRGNKAYFPLPDEGNSRKLKRRDSDPALYKNSFLQFNSYHGKTENEKERKAFSRFFENKEFALDFLDSFITEILQDDIVPDVLIEALTESFTTTKTPTPTPTQKTAQSPVKIQLKAESPDILLLDPALIEQQHFEAILDEVVIDLLRELSIDTIRTTLKDFVDSHLMKVATYEIIDEILLETIHAISPGIIQEACQEIEYEEILHTIVSDTTEEEVKSLVYSVIGECDVELLQQQQNQVAMYAGRQLIETFFMEHLIDMIGGHGPVLFGKDPAVTLLEGCLVDILLHQCLSIQKHQEATLENVPIAHFHEKIFEESALDVILTELSKMMDEDMEDFFEYERKMELGEFI